MTLRICFERPGAKRPARGGEHDPPHVLAPARAQRLEDRIVLGIDRQDGGAFGGRAAHEQRAGTDEAFLIGERDGRAALGGGERRREACRAGYRRHDPLGRPLRGFDDRAGAGGGLDVGAGKFGFQFAIGGRIRHRGKTRAEFARQARERTRFAVRSHRLDPVAVGVAAQQIGRARTDRAGRAKQRHRARRARQFDFRQWAFLCHAASISAASASSRYHTNNPRAGAAMPWRKTPIRTRGQRGDQKTVETIHHAAMAGNEVTRVLGTKSPLHRGLEQVPALRNDRKHQCQNSRHGRSNSSARIGDQDAGGNPPEQAAKSSGPGLVRAQTRPQQRTADGAAHQIGENVGRPDDREQEKERRKTERYGSLRNRTGLRSATPA